MSKMPEFADRNALRSWFDSCRPPNGEYPLAFRCYWRVFTLIGTDRRGGSLSYVNKATSTEIRIALEKNGWTRRLSETFFNSIDLFAIPEEVLKSIME